MTHIDVVIETPKGSPLKFNFDPDTRFFKLKKSLPAGLIFPYDFGFIPNTRSEAGDPLDAIILSEFTGFPGCLMECRIIGAFLAEQQEKKNTFRNDRYIAVPLISQAFKKMQSVVDIGHISVELENFFIAYNDFEGRSFRLLQTIDARDAMQLIKDQTVQ